MLMVSLKSVKVIHLTLLQSRIPVVDEVLPGPHLRLSHSIFLLPVLQDGGLNLIELLSFMHHLLVLELFVLAPPLILDL